MAPICPEYSRIVPNCPEQSRMVPKSLNTGRLFWTCSKIFDLPEFHFACSRIPLNCPESSRTVPNRSELSRMYHSGRNTGLFFTVWEYLQHLTHTLEMDARCGVTSQTSPTSLPQRGHGAPRACNVACIAIQTLINQTQIENTKPTRKESKKKKPELNEQSSTVVLSHNTYIYMHEIQGVSKKYTLRKWTAK